MAHHGTASTCVPCASGYYCPGFSKGRVACPPHTTTTAQQLPATAISDCVCINPKMQIEHAQEYKQQAPGALDRHQCVCRAGWLQSR